MATASRTSSREELAKGEFDDTVRGGVHGASDIDIENGAKGTNWATGPAYVHIKSHEDSTLNGNDVCSPPTLYHRVAAMGEAKAKKPLVFLIPQGVMAGFFIGIGAVLAGWVGGSLSWGLSSFANLDQTANDSDIGRIGVHISYLANFGSFFLGGFGLPIGLFAVILTGADLFTGNCMVSVAALAEGKIGIINYLKLNILSWFTNFVGSLLVVALVEGGGRLDGNTAAREFFVGAAQAKSLDENTTFGALMSQAILANFLVCLAVMEAASTHSFVGKALAAWMPVAMFAALGFEHSVANMTLIPLGMLHTSEVTVGNFLFHNLLSVTIGNWVGGGFILAGVGAITQGRTGTWLQKWLPY